MSQVDKRRELIIEYVSRHGTLSTRELQQELNISAMTLWRDLKELEKQGAVRCIHGGVCLAGMPPLQRYGQEAEFSEKLNEHNNRKQAIASYAVSHFIDPGDIIVIEGGTTAAFMLNFIGKSFSDLTILTNSLEIANSAKSLSATNTLICSGGVLREVSSTFVGPMAEDFFSKHHSSKLFLSGTGFDFNTGITDPNPLEVQTKQAMLDNTDKAVFLIDSSKFSKCSLMSVITPEKIKTIITDSQIPEKTAVALRSIGIDLHIVDLTV